MRFWGIVINITLLAGLAFAQAQSNFDPGQNTWTLSNGWIRASFQLTPEGYFLTQQISDLQSGVPICIRPGPVEFRPGTEYLDPVQRLDPRVFSTDSRRLLSHPTDFRSPIRRPMGGVSEPADLARPLTNR